MRLRAGDAGALVAGLPAGALSRVAILYPDPWPKRRHNKRRLISDVLIGELAKAMRPGAEICALRRTSTIMQAGRSPASCARGNFIWRAERADDWRRPWPDWPGTRYEAKASREGRPPVYLTFARA